METTVREFIVENFLFGQPNGLADNDSLLDKGVIDSTGVLELIDFIENQYELKVADEEIVPENFDSIERICRYLRSKESCK